MNKTDKPAVAPAVSIAPNGEEKKLALAADFGQVYLKIFRGQIMRPIRAVMDLFEKLGHIYKVAGSGDKEKWAITAAGYSHLNKIASISLLTPNYVIVDGAKQPNPYIMRNGRTRAIEVVHIRKLGIGYSPAGNVVVLDKTLYYNLYTYWIQSIQAKMKRVIWENGHRTDKKEFPDCAVVGIEGEKPKVAGSWVFFPTEPPLGLWANYTDSAILDCMEEHTQRQRFGDRIAEKIVSRNILKDHPAIAATNVFVKNSEAGPRTTVTVYGWRNELGPQDLSQIKEQAEAGIESAPFEIHAEKIVEVESEAEEEVLKEETQEDRAAHEPGDLFGKQEPPK
jgi:hypothetical protein